MAKKRNSMVPHAGNGLALHGFVPTRTGLTVTGKPTLEDWESVGRFLHAAEGSVHFWIGDWLRYGERVYGKTYEQAEELTGFDNQTLRDDAWIASKVDLSRRRDNLSFSHHAEVAALEPAEQDELLERAEAEKWTRSQLRDHVKQIRLREALDDAGAIPKGKYRVLLADPPWEYGDQRGGGIQGGAASAHYPTMPTPAICELADAGGRKVRDVAAADAALFLWATAPCLADALAVVAAWGFEYKAQFVWDKVRGFNGHYNDVQHELLLIGTRGSCVPNVKPLPKSVVRAEKDRHSRKPDIFHEIIEAMYPPRKGQPTHLELFARRPRPGWASWGNEV